MSTTFSQSELTAESFVQRLLQEQSEMSAVERFSIEHDEWHASTEPAQAKYYRSLLPAEPPAMGQQYAFQVDLDACSGCKACVVACHTLNGLEEEESWRRVGQLTSDTTLAQIKHVTTACHHCSDPGCLKGCPVLAYDKDPESGVVRHLDDQCIGCKYCTMMCPYEVPKYSARLGIVRKCDMCHQRLSRGEAPACVQSCPNEAISIRVVPREQALAAEQRLVPGAPLSSITQPTTQYLGAMVTEEHATLAQDAELDAPAESHWPLAVLLVFTQASVGLLLAERIWALGTQLRGEAVPLQLTIVVGGIALLLATVGLAVAPLHLGQPWRSWRVFLGLRTSWLSREAVLLGKYVGLLLVSVVLMACLAWAADAPWASPIPPWLGKLALGMSLLLGVAGLFSSAMIYIATQRELWSPHKTFTRFFGSAMVVGTLGGATLTGATTLAFFAAITLLGKLVWEWRDALGGARTSDTEYERRSRKLIHQRLSQTLRWRLATGGFATALAVWGGWCLAHQLTLLGASVLGVATGVALAGELLERLLYFSSVVYDRMPGALP